MSLFFEVSRDLLSESRVNQENAAILEEQVSSQSASHAYVFCGDSIRHLQDLALAFFASLSCPSKGCSACSSCRSIAKKNNPNLLLLEAAGPVITTEEVSPLLYFLNLSAAGVKKAAIIVEADLMNETASNKLLKTLEEPPDPDSLILLLTERPQSILPTILSRCQVFLWEFRQQAEEENSIFFKEIQGLVHEVLSGLAFSPEKESLCLDGSTKIVDALDEKSRQYSRMLEEDSGDWEDPGLDARLAKRMEAVMASRKKRQLSKFNHFGIQVVFDIITDWLDDIMALQAGAQSQDLNFPFLHGLLKGKKADPDRFIRLIKTIDKTRLYLNYSINRELALDCILLQFIKIEEGLLDKR